MTNKEKVQAILKILDGEKTKNARFILEVVSNEINEAIFKLDESKEICLTTGSSRLLTR